MAVSDVYTLQDQVQIRYILKRLRWNQVVTNHFFTTLDSLQLCTGFITPLLQHTTTPIN